MTRAPDILTAALGHMQDRAATYDKPEGERSMPATVAAFNAITGLEVTAEQGWLFAVLLKAVRSQQGGYRPDNYEDGAAYFALMGEQAAADRKPVYQGRDVSIEFVEKLPPVAELDPEQFANSSKSATHRDGGGNLYKVCDMSGRWLRHGSKCWVFASSDPKAEPADLQRL